MGLLSAKTIESGYGKKQILFGVDMTVDTGEIVAIIGPNGAGKSTLLKTICGLIMPWSGSIRFDGVDITKASPAKNVANGITFAPQGSRVFDELTVLENLEIGGFQLKKQLLVERIDTVMQFFPVLKKRAKALAGKMSGGEQQMLAIARSLIPQPKLLMLDEPSLGLSPGLVNEVFEKISEINQELGVSFLIVEQKVREVFKVAQKVYSLKLGKVAYNGPTADLANNQEKLRDLFL